MTLVHWDEVPWQSVDRGRLRWERQRLVPRLSRYRIAARSQLFPAHVHVDEAEHVVVLAGGGVSWVEGTAHQVAAGDVVVHEPDAGAHTLLAGDDGLEVLIFGTGSATGLTRLPRAGVVRIGDGWWPPEVADPLDAEPPLDPPPPSGRVGPPPESAHARLSTTRLAAGEANAPPHWHTAEHEHFVVTDGDGVLVLGDDEHPLRAGSVVHRPPGTGVPHALRAGADGMAMLVHGTREPGDVVVEPGTGTLLLGGLRVLVRYEETEE